MCIIIVKPQGKDLPQNQLENSFDNNPDGAGYMFNNSDGKIIIKKPFFNYERFLSSYLGDLKNNPEATFVLHFRITTHGENDKVNTHPHRLTKRLAFAHNGVIRGVGESKKLSDTVLFSKKLLGRFTERELFERSEVIMLMEDFLLGSKITILNADGGFIIYNESDGHWEGGLWYSNETYSYSHNYKKNTSSLYNSSSRYATDMPWENDECMDISDYYKNKQQTIEIGEKCYYCSQGLDTSDEQRYGLCQGCIDALLDDNEQEKLFSSEFLLESGKNKDISTHNGTQW